MNDDIKDKIGKIANEKVFRYRIPYYDEYDLCLKAVELFCTHQHIFLENIKLQSRHRKLLAFYLQHGYNKESRSKAMKYFNLTENYLRTMNYNLSTCKCIVSNRETGFKRDICPTLVNLKNYLKDKSQQTKKFVFVLHPEIDNM